MLPPNSRLTRLVDASIEPLTLADAKTFLRIDNDADDAFLTDAITTARLECEQICDQSFIATTWRLDLDHLPFAPCAPSGRESQWGTWGTFGPSILFTSGGIRFPKPPLLSVVSFSYFDQSGQLQSLDVTSPSSLYRVSPGTPGWLTPIYGTFFPFTQAFPGAISIVFVAGYGPDATFVPKTVIMAMRFLVGHYHRHRTVNAPIPDAVSNLLNVTSWGGYA